MSLRIIIAGGREFNDYYRLERLMDHLLKNRKPEEVVLISGAARGADRLGERYGRARGITVEQHPANWDKYGKSAGYRRNEEMAATATHLVAFWDGKSRGTKHMIDTAKTKGLHTTIKEYT